MTLDQTTRVLEALERHGVRYAVFGAVALNIYGLVRATEDLDIFVAPEPENVGALKAALMEVFGDPSVEEISAEELAGDYPAVQYNPPEGGFHVDIVTRLGEAFRFEDLEVERVESGGRMIPVVTPRMLYRMKKDTVRGKDRLDAQLIQERFGFREE